MRDMFNGSLPTVHERPSYSSETVCKPVVAQKPVPFQIFHDSLLTPPPSPPIPPPSEWEVVRPKDKLLSLPKPLSSSTNKPLSPKPKSLERQLQEQKQKLKKSKKKLIPEPFSFEGYELSTDDEEGLKGSKQLPVMKENIGAIIDQEEGKGKRKKPGLKERLNANHEGGRKENGEPPDDDQKSSEKKKGLDDGQNSS